jgi:hypothetical protein
LNNNNDRLSKELFNHLLIFKPLNYENRFVWKQLIYTFVTQFMQDYKSIEERAIFDLFASLLPDFPPGQRIQRESPDFVVRQKNRRSTGIELTKIIGHKVARRLTLEDLQQAIDRKNNKLPLYQTAKTNALWLVLLIGFDPLAMNAKPTQNALNHAYQTRFHRVFLFDIQHKVIHELHLSS